MASEGMLKLQALYRLNLQDQTELLSHLSADKIILHQMLPTGSPEPGEMNWGNAHSLVGQTSSGYAGLNTKG